MLVEFMLQTIFRHIVHADQFPLEFNKIKKTVLCCDNVNLNRIYIEKKLQ